MKVKPCYFFTNWFLFLILLKYAISEKSELPLQNLNNIDSEIHLVVSGGVQNILSNNYEGDIPYKIIVNGNDEFDCLQYCYLEEDNNYITFKFNVRIKTCAYMFEDLEYIKEIDLSGFDMSQVTSMKSMFNNCINLEYINLNNINISSVEDMSYLFSSCISLESIDLSNLDISKVTNISSMFSYCENIEYINLNNLNISSVKDMSYLFYECNSLTSIDISKNLSSVINMSYLFYGCESLESIDLSYFDISKIINIEFMFDYSVQFINLSHINASTVEDMSSLFGEDEYFNYFHIESIDLSYSDFSKVKNISNMFSSCCDLEYINLSNINISSVEYMDSLFFNCISLTSLDLSNLDISKVKDMNSMFQYCSNLEYINLTKINISSVKNMSYLFYGCESLVSIDLSNLSLLNLMDLSYIFLGCSNLEYINISNINISSVETIINLFYGCENLISIDLSYSDLSNVKNLSNMFYDCYNLEYINLKNVILSSIENVSYLFHNLNNLISIDLSYSDFSKALDLSGMFRYCYDLEYINFTKIDISSVENMSYFFYYCENLVSIDFSNLDISNVKDINYMFYFNKNLRFINLSNINATSIENMSSLFYKHYYSKKNLENFISIDLSYSDFSKVKDISSMFRECKSLKYVNLTKINLSSVKNMSYLFYKCESLITIDLSNFDISNVRDISYMFSKCENLEYINLTKINISSVEIMSYLFDECEGLTSIDLSDLELSNVRDISCMFCECKNLNYIQLTNKNLSFVEDMSSLFYNCENLISINLSNLDISKVTDISSIFFGCNNLEYINLSKINISSVENIRYLFYDCKLLKSIDLSNSVLSNVKDMTFIFESNNNLKFINLSNIIANSVKNMSYLFYDSNSFFLDIFNCKNLVSVDLSNSDFSNVKDMSSMFKQCKSLVYINLTNINISSVEYMSSLFYGCENLRSIDLSNIDISKARDMSSMFSSCSFLKYINLTNTNLSSVENIKYLFYSCSILGSVNLKSFEISKIRNMHGTFYDCISLENINFGILDTSFVNDMSQLFYNCISLSSIDLSNFNTSKVTDLSSMFYNCFNLKYLNLSSFDTSKVVKASNMFNGCSNLIYLDLAHFNTLNMKEIDHMFYNCKSLIYLNLYSFKLTSLVEKEFIFKNLSSFTKYCINDLNTANLLGVMNNNCSHSCFKKNRKIDLYNRTCAELCIQNKILYEYKNFCYNKCPKGTFVNGPICEEINSTEYIYIIPQGYYFDPLDELYKKCYDSCKSCNYGGNITKHNCTECKENFISLNGSMYETNCYEKCEYYYYFDDLNNYYHCTEKKQCPEKYNKLIQDKKICTNDCKKDETYQYEFNNKCIVNCPIDTYYNESDKICYYYESFTNTVINTFNEGTENFNEDEIKTSANLIYSSEDISTMNEVFSEVCHENCQECTDYSSDDQNMKCISRKNGFTMIIDTQNCVNKKEYPSYFLYFDRLVPCSFLDSFCYECDPLLFNNINDACLSCMPGYIYDKKNKRCEACKENEYPIGIQNFYSCKDVNTLNCHLYTTYCISLKNEELEKLCEKNNFKNETCLISINKKILSINWLKEGSYNFDYPCYNNDKSNYLLIELTLDSFKRKLFFYNEEGRGLFDEINDKFEINIVNRRAFSRGISSSIALKVNNSEEYRYLFNFENYNNNIELIDINTGEIFIDNLFNFLWKFDFGFLDFPEKPTTELLELNENNQFLLATFAKDRINNKIVILYFIFYLEDLTEQKINIDSLKKIDENILDFNDLIFNIYERFYFIQTKSGNLYLSFVSEKNDLYYFDIQENKKYFIYSLSNKMSFQKLILIKDEIKFLCYYSFDKYIVFLIFETIVDSRPNTILESKFEKYLPYSDNNNCTDVIFFSEVKAVFVLEQANSITIFILNFFNDYKIFMKNEYLINIYGNEINNINIYSLIFKYRNILGLQFKNEEENGFILFGYYNSTDPKQILDIKKDGLNYNINLADYLNLQSNIFDYEIKCIRIIEVPNPEESGLYLFSNVSKNYIQKNDCVNINNKISLYFSYNGTLKKDNYFFKFVGVLQEPKYEIIQKNSEEAIWNIQNNNLKRLFIEEYNERRNMNITGRIALVQINVLNNINVFCDKKYDQYALKSKEGKFIGCGEGKFYDVENVNEITQLNLGKNYYFDNIKNYYIKCHEKCKTCSRKFNDTHMNCDVCIDNYFIQNDNCYEISKCEYNYYYDKDLNLKCINKDSYCPDFKPYENSITKECLQNCNINEFNKKCNPTNNRISILDTRTQIFENIKFLNLEEKLFINKTKYVIFGNNVTFLLSSSEIEKMELNENYNTSSVILGESEKQIKQFFSLNEDQIIPMLKIETRNNHSNDSDLSYELFNPTNLSQKLDLNLLSENYIEIRKPIYLKPYKMDLILKTRELGYNIFDLNDPFYNDICSVFSYNNTDFSLSERKNIIDLSDENLCLDGCNYSNFDIKTLRTICSCKIGFGENDGYKSDIKNDNNKYNKDLVNLVKQNIDISKSSNIKVVKCFSIIFRKNLFTENYGFYIMLLLLLINMTTLIFSPISKIEKTLNEYCNKILSNMKIIYINNNVELSQNKNKKKFENNKNQMPNIKKPMIQDYTINSCGEKTDISFKKMVMNNSDIISEEDEKEKKIIKNLKEKKNSDFYVYYVIKIIKPEKRKEYLSEYEIEDLSYLNALQIEDRNKSNYYFALLKEKNKIISIFLNDEDYNIQSIKISTFIFNFSLSLTINALFYNDEAIYEINQQKQDKSLLSQYSRILYSAIISGFLNFVIELLSYPQQKIIKLRYYKEIKEVENEIPKLVRLLKIRCIFYFILALFFNLVFLYYITAFCSIYNIIQIRMISEASISFLLTMSYTLILSLISSIIRIFSLQKKNRFRHFLYIISWIISLI